MKFFRRYIRPNLLTIIGVAVTILSALINNYSAKANMSRISDAQSQISEIEKQIDFRWQEVKELERWEEFAVILDALPKNETVKPAENIVSKEVTRFIGKLTAVAGEKYRKILESEEYQKTGKGLVEKIFIIVDECKAEAIKHIDDTYLNKVNLEQEINALKEKNSLLSTIALFLQIMGVILVLVDKTGKTSTSEKLSSDC